jgi:hypothetical protein
MATCSLNQARIDDWNLGRQGANAQVEGLAARALLAQLRQSQTIAWIDFVLALNWPATLALLLRKRGQDRDAWI